MRNALYKFNPYNIERFITSTFAQRSLKSLPDVALDRVIQDGRCAHDGYQRSIMCAENDLKMLVWRDPLYQRARKASRGRSLLMEERRMNIFLLIVYFFESLESKNIIEFGAYRGGNAVFMATLLRELYPDARVFALDTFEGMPAVDSVVDLHKKADLRATLEDAEAAAKAANLENIHFIKGLIEDTAESVYAKAGGFGLAHIDVDIYSAVAYSQKSVWPHMCPGGYVVYDDATTPTCLGATLAVEELIRDRGAHSEQIWPHFVFRT